MQAAEEPCTDAPAQGLLNSQGVAGVCFGGWGGGQGNNEVWDLESRNLILTIWRAGTMDARWWEKQAEAISGISPEDAFFLLLVA